MPRNANFADERRPFSFPEWKETLQSSSLAESQRADFRRVILGFLHRCKTDHAPASVALVKTYLAERAGGEGEREALRWFFSRGQYRPRRPAGPAAPSRPVRVAQPTRASQDLGGAEWERDLIAAIRERGLLWRTEETYREWAARFARFLAPRSPYAAEAAREPPEPQPRARDTSAAKRRNLRANPGIPGCAHAVEPCRVTNARSRPFRDPW